MAVRERVAARRRPENGAPLARASHSLGDVPRAAGPHSGGPRLASTSLPNRHPACAARAAGMAAARAPPARATAPPPPTAPAPRPADKALADVLDLLRGPTDERRLVGLLLAAKLLPAGGEATLRAVCDAVGLEFLRRLLLPLTQETVGGGWGRWVTHHPPWAGGRAQRPAPAPPAHAPTPFPPLFPPVPGGDRPGQGGPPRGRGRPGGFRAGRVLRPA